MVQREMPFDEGKAKLNGVEIPIQCILLNIPKTTDYTGRAHYHDYIELLYCTQGDIDVNINGRDYNFKVGEMIIINSREAHTLKFNGDTNVYIVVKFSPQVLYTTEQTIFEMKYLFPFIIANTNHQRVFSEVDKSNTFLHDIMTNIMREWQLKDYAYELAMRADILKLFLWIFRNWHNNKVDVIGRFDRDDDLCVAVQKAIEYTSKNYAYADTSSVAKECGLSYSYFSRSFKSLMNMSFTEYINFVRVNHAERLLVTTDLSMTEIASQVGFSTSSYFIQRFKALKKISPKQYRMKFSTQQN